MTFANRRNKTIITFSPGEVIFHEGAQGEKMFIIKNGEVALSKKIDEMEVPLQNLKAGTLFGEMALVDNQPRSATARAVTEVSCLSMSKVVFQHKLTNEVPRWMQLLYELMVGRLRMLILQTRSDRGGLPGHQIVEVLAMLLQRGKPDEQGCVLVNWDQTTRKIAYILRLPEKNVSEALKILAKSDIARSAFDERRRRIFIVPSLDKFLLLADFCRESFLVERRQKKHRDILKVRKLEEGFLQKLSAIIGVDEGIHVIAVQELSTRLREDYQQSLEYYEIVIRNLINMNIIVKENSELQGLVYSIDLEQYKAYLETFDLHPLFKDLLQQLTKGDSRTSPPVTETLRQSLRAELFNE
ncbi:MAG: cyclic nucleotide-binding domain-containing protein [Candidatus Neomarinimicrobiota bacterium]